MKRFLSSTMILLLCVLFIHAQHRSDSQAIQIARDFFMDKGKSPELTVVPQAKVQTQIRKKLPTLKTASSSTPAYYVVNDEANGRFVIISADERLYTILGYSDNGCFDAEKAPEGLLELMESYNAQYNYLLSEDISNEVRKDARESGIEVKPLVQSKWGQGTPYNLLCPENKKYSTGENCATGCVATAMAQIMYYHKYPKQGQGGSYIYKTSSQGEWLNLNFNSLILDWDNMLKEYNGFETETQNNAVANLMYACGVSVTMDYGVDEAGQSGANSQNVAYALIHYFGYNSNTVYYNRAYYSDEEWRSIIMNEIEASRPIFYTGMGTGGHAFILDGCDTEGKFHFNFGANGTCDGYYELDAIVLIDGALNIHNYSYYQDMVCHICPQETCIHEDIFYSDNFTIDNADYSETRVGRSVDFEFSPICFSSNSTYEESRISTFSGKLGIGLFDTDFNYLQSLKEYNVSDVAIGEGYNVRGSISLSSSTFNDGAYYIAPYSRATESKAPTRIRTSRGERDWYYAIVDNGELKLQVNGGPTTPLVLPIVEGDFNITASNKSNTEEKWNIKIWQDREDKTKYWISNLDPAVVRKGFNYESGWNKVYGYINETHTQLSVPVNQEIGKDIVIRNISGGDNITILLTEKDGMMYFSGINDVWGSKELSAESDMSRYQYTTIAYGKIDTSDSVEVPSIDVLSNSFTIHCATKGAIIYYTTDSSTPNESSSRYNDEPVPLFHNCTIKAIAYRDGLSSEVAVYKVTTFKVETPEIHQEGNNITFTCATEGASIYYDWDGKTRQSGSLTIGKSGVIKVYAEKDDFITSDVKEQSLVYSPDPIDPGILVISDNEAGKLSSRISNTDKLSATRLVISGKINGTDIIFIREMFYDGKLTDLDIENASIVSGGETYDTTIHAVTKDNIVGQYFFENCKQMVSIKLPSNAVKIESGAFSGCSSLKRLDIPTSCIEVESMSISRCDKLEEVNLSDAVQKYPGLSVYSCKNLRRINVGEGNPYFKSVDGVLFTKDGTKIVRYPMGKNDVTYSIPNGVVTIGEEAFDYAMIANITIPNTVTGIESSAFENCKNMQSLTIPNSVRTIGTSAFFRRRSQRV